MFAKTPSDALASLVKEIDKTVGEHKSSKVAAVLNFTDSDPDAIKEFAKDIKNVAVTVTGDGGKFKVNDDAEFTLMAYNKKKVVFNYAVTKEGLSKAKAKELLAVAKDAASKLLD